MDPARAGGGSQQHRIPASPNMGTQAAANAAATAPAGQRPQTELGHPAASGQQRSSRNVWHREGAEGQDTEGQEQGQRLRGSRGRDMAGGEAQVQREGQEPSIMEVGNGQQQDEAEPEAITGPGGDGGRAAHEDPSGLRTASCSRTSSKVRSFRSGLTRTSLIRIARGSFSSRYMRSTAWLKARSSTTRSTCWLR